jgi:hypothetical protein
MSDLSPLSWTKRKLDLARQVMQQPAGELRQAWANIRAWLELEQKA